jgi:hypothetical protein
MKEVVGWLKKVSRGLIDNKIQDERHFKGKQLTANETVEIPTLDT